MGIFLLFLQTFLLTSYNPLSKKRIIQTIKLKTAKLFEHMECKLDFLGQYRNHCEFYCLRTSSLLYSQKCLCDERDVVATGDFNQADFSHCPNSDKVLQVTHVRKDLDNARRNSSIFFRICFYIMYTFLDESYLGRSGFLGHIFKMSGISNCIL